MVFASVGILAFLLSLSGLAFVRVYDDQLIRQTESELIAQGAVVAEVFHRVIEDALGAEAETYGNPRTAPWPFPRPAGERLAPILPSLRASSITYPSVGDPPRAPAPADGRAQEAGGRLRSLLSGVTRSTLAGIRVVDAKGVVVASSNSETGTTLADRLEVQKALRGEPHSLLRARVSDTDDAPLASLSRNTGVRVTVALPVLHQDRVWGAVVLTRTPMTFAKAVYADRWNLTATALVLVVAIGLMSIAAAALVVRPVRALVRQTRAIAAHDDAGLEPLRAPGVHELAQLSEALAAMARTLRDRNQYIRSFSANVSHEFKTPLSAIQGAVELLRDSGSHMDPAQRDRFLANVEKDARRLAELVRRLLELARADARVATPSQTELGPLLGELSARAVAQGIDVDVSSVPSSFRVPLPADVLDSVLWQLITNAREHGGEGVRVGLTVEQGSASSPMRLIVRDDGRGVSPANRSQIFDAFFTTARDRGGTGLGLTICRSLLRAFGARLEYVEPEGPGAAFAVVIDQRKSL